MADGRTSTADTADTAAPGPGGHWASLSERFLAAAEALPADVDAMALPRTHLLGLALEFRLKAFFHAVRGGAPDTADLTRLVSLAGHCGLQLTGDQREAIARLNRAGLIARSNPTVGALSRARSTAPVNQDANADSRPAAADVEYLRALCATISEQAAASCR